MNACVIPFPARRAAAEQTPYEALKACLADAPTTEAPRRGAGPGSQREDEILKLLRRIDRRLAKLAAA